MSTPHQVQAAPQLAVIHGDEEMGNGAPMNSTSATVGAPIPTSVMKATLDMSSSANISTGDTPTTSTKPSSTIPTSSSAIIASPEGPIRRMVAVRYFLDRPGYGLHNAAVRLWIDPPTVCVPSDLHQYLMKHGIIPSDDETGSAALGDNSSHYLSTNSVSHDGFASYHHDDFLVEVYLDKFQSFMLLQACEDAKIEWNLSDSTMHHPGTFNVRLTDISHHIHDSHEVASKSVVPPVGASVNANTAPVGLFAFSFMVGLETLFAMERLIRDPDGNNFFFGIDPAYVITWGPYMVFSGGGLMWITGVFQVFRNNIYGAVAFLVFGSFWFANGTKVILETHFSGPGTKAYDLKQSESSSDPWGSMIRFLYIMGFVVVLLGNTFAGSKVSTCLMSLLICKFLCQIGAAWSDVAGWMQVFFGWLVSWLAFYVFLVEMTNQVYHREVFELHKWSEEHSPGEMFAQPGNGQHTLYSKAQRKVKRSFSNITKVRMALHRSASSVLHHGKKTD
jgi:succinate-acetate transporter protein